MQRYSKTSKLSPEGYHSGEAIRLTPATDTIDDWYKVNDDEESDYSEVYEEPVDLSGDEWQEDDEEQGDTDTDGGLDHLEGDGQVQKAMKAPEFSDDEFDDSDDAEDDAEQAEHLDDSKDEMSQARVYEMAKAEVIRQKVGYTDKADRSMQPDANN